MNERTKRFSLTVALPMLAFLVLALLMLACGDERRETAAGDGALIQGALLDAPVEPRAPPQSASATPSPAPEATGAAPATSASPTQASGTEELAITWDLLATYQISAADAEPRPAPPAEIQVLNDRRVHITGFMIPLDLNEDRITSFMLSRYPPQCCFGQLPFLNEWVSVDAKEIGGVPFAHFSYVTVSGRFTLKDASHTQDELVNLYHLSAESVHEEL